MPPPRTALQMTPRLYRQNKKVLPEKALPEQKKKFRPGLFPSDPGRKIKRIILKILEKAPLHPCRMRRRCLYVYVSASVPADFHSPDQDSAAVMIDME